MVARIVRCARPQHDPPGLDEPTAESRNALRHVCLTGGAELRPCLRGHASVPVCKQRTGYQVIGVDVYRIDRMSEEARRMLRNYMEAFFLGQERAINNYVPPGEPAAVLTSRTGAGSERRIPALYLTLDSRRPARKDRRVA